MQWICTNQIAVIAFNFLIPKRKGNWEELIDLRIFSHFLVTKFSESTDFIGWDGCGGEGIHLRRIPNNTKADLS